MYQFQDFYISVQFCMSLNSLSDKANCTLKYLDLPSTVIIAFLVRMLIIPILNTSHIPLIKRCTYVCIWLYVFVYVRICIHMNKVKSYIDYEESIKQTIRDRDRLMMMYLFFILLIARIIAFAV